VGIGTRSVQEQEERKRVDCVGRVREQIYGGGAARVKGSEFMIKIMVGGWWLMVDGTGQRILDSGIIWCRRGH
jgi:hypothetical protein